MPWAWRPIRMFVGASNDTTYRGRQYVGVGVLNTERQSSGVFNAQTDDIGILGDIPPIVLPDLTTDPAFPLCQTILGTSVQIFPWGDLSARCTRGNGFLDTEDLNGDNILNAQGPNDNVNRYVVSLTDTQYRGAEGRPGSLGRGLDAVPGAAAHADGRHRHAEHPAGAGAAGDAGGAARRIDDIVARLALDAAHVRGCALAGAGAGADRGDRRLHGGTDGQRGGLRHLDARQDPRVHPAAGRPHRAQQPPGRSQQQRRR